jgi:hypothetical protein
MDSLSRGLNQSNWDGRHPSTQHMMRMLAPNPNLSGPLFNTAQNFQNLANSLTAQLPDSPELTAGLRKLLEAKDCFVRAQVFNVDPTSPSANVDYRDR